jgi:(2Fe-2S) ferredoxin
MRGRGRLVKRLRTGIDGDGDLRVRVFVRDYICYGRCEDGPNLFVHALAEGEDPDQEPPLEVLETRRGFYPGMDEQKVVRVLEAHCGRGRVLEDLVDDY